MKRMAKHVSELFSVTHIGEILVGHSMPSKGDDAMRLCN